MIRSLFEQASIKGIHLKNRFVRSATAESMATSDGFPTKDLKNLYCTLADGELGLIITSGSLIEPWKNNPQTLGLRSPLAIYEDGYIDAWQEIIRDVHERGAKIAMQIGHLGRQDVPELRGSALMAPSAVNLKGSNIVTHEMTVNEIRNIVEKFAQACRRVKEAGFDAVQLHFAHEDLEKRSMILEEFGIPVKQAVCEGCRNEKGEIRHNSTRCSVYPYPENKGVKFCFECEDFPCDHLHPYADQAEVKAHNLKVFNLCLIKKMGLDEWARKAIDIGETYFNGKWTL